MTTLNIFKKCFCLHNKTKQQTINNNLNQILYFKTYDDTFEFWKKKENRENKNIFIIQQYIDFDKKYKNQEHVFNICYWENNKENTIEMYINKNGHFSNYKNTIITDDIIKYINLMTNKNLIPYKEKNENENQNCIICLKQYPNITFISCGHICLCDKCSQKINKCPICRSNGDKIKLYYL